MNMTGHLFPLPRNPGGYQFEETHWSVLGDPTTVMHHPSSTVFEIAFPDGVEEAVDIHGLGARLVHVCDGRAIPTIAAQRALACEALVFWGVENGLLVLGKKLPGVAPSSPDDLDFADDIPF